TKNSRFGLPHALTELGRVEAKLGRYAEAAEHLASAIESTITDNTRPALATAAEAAAVLKERQGNPKDAARLLGAAHRLREQSEMPPYYTYRPLHEIIVRTVRTAAADSFEEAFNEGLEMRPEDIQGLLLGADDSGK
ncbi:MAG: tetratricopeptide repeat protein, partial [Actinobacteria bacterium]|nr:tetratricopeptide repeat protein [Actinomycetota bacterium]